MSRRASRMTARKRTASFFASGANSLAREGWNPVMLSVLGQQIRYALRRLLKTPGPAAAAVLSLAIGIGANTALFSVVNGLLSRRCPIRIPIVWVSSGFIPPDLASFRTGHRQDSSSMPDAASRRYGRMSDRV